MAGGQVHGYEWITAPGDWTTTYITGSVPGQEGYSCR